MISEYYRQQHPAMAPSTINSTGGGENSPQTPNFSDLGRRLLEEAKSLNRTLLTLQVGGMDGISNDPMHKMFLRSESINKDEVKSSSLGHWMPVVVEGSPSMYEKLSRNYLYIQKSHGILCSHIDQFAISYDANLDNQEEGDAETMCDFCHFNLNALNVLSSEKRPNETIPSLQSPSVCQEQPDWVKTQVGSLNCRHLEKVMKQVFKECFVRVKVRCGTVLDLFRHRLGSVEAASRIAILQIDTEGYEAILLPNLIQEFETTSEHKRDKDNLNNVYFELPPVVHYESKILRKWLRRGKNNALQTIHDMLKERGYIIFEGGEDDLAIRVFS